MKNIGLQEIEDEEQSLTPALVLYNSRILHFLRKFQLYETFLSFYCLPNLSIPDPPSPDRGTWYPDMELHYFDNAIPSTLAEAHDTFIVKKYLYTKGIPELNIMGTQKYLKSKKVKPFGACVD